MKKNQFKSLFFVVLLSILCVFTMISCDETDEPADVKVIKVWLHKSESEDEGKVYSSIAEAFNEKKILNDEGKIIQMRLEFKNSAETLATSIEAEVLTGGLPDVIALDAPDISAYVDSGIIESIDSYVSTEERSSYVDSVIEQGIVDDKLYALSGMDCPTGLYYNKTLLKQVGYKDEDFGTPDNLWSWKDLMEAMRKLKDASLPYKTKLNLGFGGDEGIMYLYSSLVLSSGGTFADESEKSNGSLNSENTIKGIRMIEKMFEIDNGETWFYNGSNTDAFAMREIAFQIYGPWDITTIKKNYADFINDYDIMPMPIYESETGEKGVAVAGCGSWCFAVTKNTKDIKSATEVVKFLTNKFSSDLMYQSIGTFPTNKESLEELKAQSVGPLASLSNILLNISTPRPKLVNYPKLSDGYSSIIEYIETTYSTAEYDLEAYIELQINQIDR